MLHLAPARRNRLILVAALAAMVLVFLWVARSALVPYIFALALAYILLPAVNRLEILFKRVFRGRSARFARPVAILLTYVLVVGALVHLLLPGGAGDRAAVCGVVGQPRPTG